MVLFAKNDIRNIESLRCGQRLITISHEQGNHVLVNKRLDNRSA